MDKLHFLTGGIPTIAKDYKEGFETLKKLGLDGLEIELVHGARMSDATKNLILENKNNLILTSHGPYYINLNAKEKEKIDASIKRIADTARIAHSVGGYSITYHAGFYLGEDSKTVSHKIAEKHKDIIEILEKEKIDIWIRPETTGKKTQWGDLDEIIDLSLKFNQVLPCIDFSHLHARENGALKTYDDFSRIFEKMGKKLGERAINNFHAHIAGIAYSIKGEKHHLMLNDSDFNYKDLMKAFKKFGIKGAIICESPVMEEDAILMKEYYESL